jgi:hypothetical protein
LAAARRAVETGEFRPQPFEGHLPLAETGGRGHGRGTVLILITGCSLFVL